MSNFQLGLDINGKVNYEIPFSTKNYKVRLNADESAVLAVPDEYDMVYIVTEGVEVSPDQMPEAITANFIETDGQLDPSIRSVKGVSELYFLAYIDTIIFVSFYKGE